VKDRQKSNKIEVITKKATAIKQFQSRDYAIMVYLEFCFHLDSNGI
jgi:hypothetical protein